MTANPESDPARRLSRPHGRCQGNGDAIEELGDQAPGGRGVRESGAQRETVDAPAVHMSDPVRPRRHRPTIDTPGNPYLAFAAMMMAGLDGIRRKIEPPVPIDKDLYELTPEESAEVTRTPPSLESVIDRLEADNDYLTEGNVFTDDLLENWIRVKRDTEISAINVRPHPYEFDLYFDV